MAISKVVYKSSPSDTGTTWMDVTGKTVTSADMLSGVTALKNDGTDITGSISPLTLPSAASASSSGTSKATITPTSSAQYLNIPTGYLDTAQFYTIAAASGGASNVVTGTFKGTTTNAAMDVALNYSGSGYPVTLVIYPKDGAYNPSGTGSFYDLVQRYALSIYLIIKNDMTAPTYQSSGNNNTATVVRGYKSSTSDATAYASSAYQGSSGKVVYNNSNAAFTNGMHVKFKSATLMSVYIGNSSNYGFAANYEYKYWVIYSS